MLALYFFVVLLRVGALTSIGGLVGLRVLCYACIFGCGMVFVGLFCLLASGLVGLCFVAGVVCEMLLLRVMVVV